MKNIRSFSHLLVLILVMVISPAISWSQYYKSEVNDIGVSHFQWPEGKKMAISLSFDDARASQVDNGVPIFDKYGIKTTFYANPESLETRLDKWKTAAVNGHEIANHTVTHPCSGNFAFSKSNALEDYTLKTIAQDIDSANDWIEQLIGMSSDGYRFTHIKKLIEQAKAMGGWLVLCGHEILPESKNIKQSTYTSMLEELCAYAINPENGIWIAPVKEVAKYIQESRDETKKEYQIYLDPEQSNEQRVNDLLSKMTLEEKIGQINMPALFTNDLGESIEEKMEGCKDFTRGKFEPGVGPGGGFFSIPDRVLHKGPRQQAQYFNELQKIAREETSLGIPLFIIEEGTHGFRASGGTIFPEGLAIGSTWNMDLVEKIYSTAAKEARNVGVHQLYTLVIEPIRDPRLGRNEEAYSEDPYLCSQIAEYLVKGTQGEDISSADKLIAGLCHFPGQSQGTGGFERSPMEISERQLREVFLPPWEAGIKKAGALGVMATYPSIDGIPAHASEKLLTGILREELGFDGIVVSEGAGFATIVHDGIAENQKEAGIKAINAGVDVGITYEPAFMRLLSESVQEGRVHISKIDRAVKRVLQLKLQMGLFENPFVNPDKAVKVSHNHEAQKLALQVAKEGIVLLKNENNLLPLDKNIKTIAVIGPNADNERNQLGDYAPLTILQDIVTVLDGIKSKVSTNTKVSYVKGCNVLKTDFNEIEKARKAAKKADVAIVVVGENEWRATDKEGNRIGTNGEGNDVASLDLTGLQEELIREVQSTGTPTIVVLVNGRPLSIRWPAENVTAIVEAWIPGEKGGDAIADVLFGDFNPNGRLPITIPRHSGQLPMYYNYNPAKTHLSKQQGYRDMPMSPLYEFGFGLSYTKFEYSNLQIQQENEGIASDVIVKMDVKNIGERVGAEVVQLYINDKISAVATPYIELKGFNKVWLSPNEKQTVEFILTPHDLAFINTDMKPIVEPGEFEVMIGSSSKDIRLKGAFVKH